MDHYSCVGLYQTEILTQMAVFERRDKVFET
jgi:hypothetical protein